MNTVVKTETPKVAMPVAIPQNKPGLSAYQIAVNNGSIVKRATIAPAH